MVNEPQNLGSGGRKLYCTHPVCIYPYMHAHTLPFQSYAGNCYVHSPCILCEDTINYEIIMKSNELLICLVAHFLFGLPDTVVSRWLMNQTIGLHLHFHLFTKTPQCINYRAKRLAMLTESHSPLNLNYTILLFKSKMQSPLQ